MTSVQEIDRLDTLTCLPWLTTLIQHLTVELSGEAALPEAYLEKDLDIDLRGELEEFLFSDRRPVLDMLKGEGLANDHQFQDGTPLRFSHGPDGQGVHRKIKNADDAIKSLESSILRLQCLRKLAWQTAILPLPSSVCRLSLSSPHCGSCDLISKVNL